MQKFCCKLKFSRKANSCDYLIIIMPSEQVLPSNIILDNLHYSLEVNARNIGYQFLVSRPCRRLCPSLILWGREGAFEGLEGVLTLKSRTRWFRAGKSAVSASENLNITISDHSLPQFRELNSPSRSQLLYFRNFGHMHFLRLIRRKTSGERKVDISGVRFVEKG